jgi:hypothetical protein
MKTVYRWVRMLLVDAGMWYLRWVVPRDQRLVITIDPVEEPDFTWLIDKPKTKIDEDA